VKGVGVRVSGVGFRIQAFERVVEGVKQMGHTVAYPKRGLW